MLLVSGVSVRGLNKNRCDDRFRYRVINQSIGIIAVADGAGSAKRGDAGALTCVSSSISFFLHHRKTLTQKENTPGLIKKAFHFAYLSILAVSRKMNLELKDLATTLIIAVIYSDSVFTGHIGDGGVVIKTKDNLIVLSEPEKSEYINETSFITDRNWINSLRINQIHTEIEGVFVFTDGCQRGILRYEGERWIPYDKFFNPVLKFFKGCTEKRIFQRDLKLLLNSEKFLKISRDDRTLVVGGYL